MNLLPLEDFRRVLGWQPFHFWGLANDTVPVTSKCNTVLKEYAWQGQDAAGRAEIREAIETAEGILRDYLGYAVAPQYLEITEPWARYYDASRERIVGADATGRWIAPRLPGAGYIQAIGVETLTLVGTVSVAGATLVFTDADGDGLYDTFIATIATAEDEPEKIAIYFAAADRLDGEGVGERWRIQPVSVAISGGTATIRGRLWLLVRPVLYQGVSPQPKDPGDITATGPYAQSLQVYTRTTDPNGETATTSQATLVWETSPCHGWWCCCGGCTSPTYDPANSPGDPAAVAYGVSRAGLRDARLGIVGIGEAIRDATTGVWSAVPWGACREPDRFSVRLLAGYPLEDGYVDRKLQVVVARLAMAELGRGVSACDTANRELFRWQMDLSRSAGNNDQVFGFITREQLNNPLGTRRGHLFAWNQIRNLRLTPGMTGF